MMIDDMEGSAQAGLIFLFSIAYGNENYDSQRDNQENSKITAKDSHN